MMKKNGEIILLTGIVVVSLCYLFSFWGMLRDSAGNRQWISDKAINYMENKYGEKFQVTGIYFDEHPEWGSSLGGAEVRVRLKPLSLKSMDLKAVRYEYRYNVILGRLFSVYEKDDYDSTFINKRIEDDFKAVLGQHFKSYQVESMIFPDSNFIIPAASPEEYKTSKRVKAKPLIPTKYTTFQDFYDHYGVLYQGDICINIYNAKLTKQNLAEFCRKLAAIRQQLDYFRTLDQKKYVYGVPTSGINGDPVVPIPIYYPIIFQIFADTPVEKSESDIRRLPGFSKYNKLEIYSEDFRDANSLQEFVLKKYPDLHKRY